MGLLEKIAEVEKEISRTQKNKATEKHLGQLRARLNKYRRVLQEREKSGTAAGDSDLDDEMAILSDSMKITAETTKKNPKKVGSRPAVPAAASRKGHTTKSTKKEKSVVTASKSESDEESSDVSSEEPIPQRSVNRFLALDSVSSDISDEEKKSEIPSTPHTAPKQPLAKVSDTTDSASANQVPELLRKRTKRKTKHKSVAHDKVLVADQKDPVEVDLKAMTEDQLLQLFAFENQQSGALQQQIGSSNSRWNPSNSPASIQGKWLNYRYELQKTAGVNGLYMSAMAADVSTRAKTGRFGPSSMVKGLQFLFVTPPQNMPERELKDFVDRYLHVDKSTDNPGSLVFKRSRRYKELQRDFLLMVYTNQDQVIQDVLHQMPFHTDALLLMCSIYERDDNFASARQMVENALLGLQQCFDHHLRNNPQSHRFSYRYPANRSFFVTLFKHILLTAPRFPKTALELGKYLFNLSPKDDPLAVILLVDYLSLKAKDFAYLRAFYAALKEQKNLELLPNFAFSVPLAIYLRSTSETTAASGKQDRDTSAHKVGDNKSGDVESANELLLDACLRFPGVVTQLYEKMEVAMDVDVGRCWLFRNASHESVGGLEILQSLYVRRCASFWKDIKVLSWLSDTLRRAKDSLSEQEVKEKVAHYEDIRKKSYRGTPSSIWRHVLLSNIPELDRLFHSQLPADSRNFVFPFDPIPPGNSEEREEYDLTAAPLTSQRGRDEARRPQPENQANTSAAAQAVGDAEGTNVVNIIHRLLNAAGMFFHTLQPSTAGERENVTDAANDMLQRATTLAAAGAGGDIITGAAINENDEGSTGSMNSYIDRINQCYEEAKDGQQMGNFNSKRGDFRAHNDADPVNESVLREEWVTSDEDA